LQRRFPPVPPGRIDKARDLRRARKRDDVDSAGSNPIDQRNDALVIGR
jgi:hypothetical protein